MLLLETKDVIKGINAIKYYALSPNYTYSGSAPVSSNYFSSFNNFVVIDDFERYTGTQHLLSEGNWFESNPTTSLYYISFSEEKDISTFSHISFFAKAEHTSSFINISLLSDYDTVSFYTFLTDKWLRYEFEYNYMDYMFEAIKQINVSFGDIEQYSSYSIYLDDIIVLDMRDVYKYNSWLPLNIISFERTTPELSLQDQNIGYYGNVIQRKTNTFYENKLICFSFPKEYLKDNDYMNFIRRENIIIYLRLPSDGNSVIIDDIKQEFINTYYGKTTKNNIILKEIIYRENGLANIYGG